MSRKNEKAAKIVVKTNEQKGLMQIFKEMKTQQKWPQKLTKNMRWYEQ